MSRLVLAVMLLSGCVTTREPRSFLPCPVCAYPADMSAYDETNFYLTIDGRIIVLRCCERGDKP